MRLEEFLDRLEGVRPSGNGHVALCPGHEDRNTSLSVTEGEEQKIVLKCHAGCQNADIVTAMGLQMRDLFANNAPVGEPEAVYQYRDRDGNVLYENLRMPGKRFRQRRYDPESPDAKADGFVYSLDEVKREPYMLPELLARQGRGVWIVEGEKDVHSMMQAGAVATNSKNWRQEWCAYVVGSPITILADRDEPGRAQAAKVEQMIRTYANGLQLAVTVRVLQSKTGKDATDHLEAGFGLDDFVPVRKGPQRGVVSSLQLVEGAREQLTKSELDRPGYVFLENAPVVFRNGRMYALGAYTSDGKSTAAVQLTRRLCATYGIRMGYFSLEMSAIDLTNALIVHKGVPLRMLEEPWTIKQHPEILRLYNEAVDEIAEWHLDISFQTKVNADYIVQTALEREHEFVVVDHIHRMGSGGDRAKFENEVQKLTNLALENDIPVLLLCQLRKASKGPNMSAAPRPTRDEFRETSVIADDAAMALSLWRCRDQSGLRFVGGTELTILKNRFTTSRYDSQGKIFMPDFDARTHLFSLPDGLNDIPMAGDDDWEEGDNDNEPDEAPIQEWGGLYD